MIARSVRAWSAVHKWTSLISTLFLLMLCITGLPLVFHDEIDDYLLPFPESSQALPAQRPSLDSIVAATLERHPGDTMVSLGFFAECPAVVAQSAPSVRAKEQHRTVFDLRTGEISAGAIQTQSAFTKFMLTLHKEMFLGLPGALFLGTIALIFLASLISGLVLYAPFMRRLDFGTLRRERSRGVYWLDLHNLAGIATLVWLLVVGTTGAINTLHDVVTAAVRAEIAQMSKRHGGEKPAKLASVDDAIRLGKAALPGGKVASFFFPGAGFSTAHHYALFARGDRPITAKLFYAALIDAETGQLAETFEMPWYAKALLLSEPLHFGDYGGLPLKIIWALFDIAAIIVLSSGLYLWFARRSRRTAPVPRGVEARG